MWNIILQNALICSTTKSGSCFKLRRFRKPLSIRLLSGLQPDRVFEDNLKPKLDSPLYDEQTFNLLDATDRTRSPLAPGTYIFPFWFYGALAHGNNLDFKAGKLSSFSVTGIRILTPLEPSIEQTESLLKTDCSSLWWVWMCVCVCVHVCMCVCWCMLWTGTGKWLWSIGHNLSFTWIGQDLNLYVLWTHFTPYWMPTHRSGYS